VYYREICGYCPRGFALTLIGCTACPSPNTLDLARKLVTVLTIIFLLALWLGVSWFKLMYDADKGKTLDLSSKEAVVVTIFKISSEVKDHIYQAHSPNLLDVWKDFEISSASNENMISSIENELKRDQRGTSSPDTSSNVEGKKGMVGPKVFPSFKLP
jgi:hypothetical protein